MLGWGGSCLVVFHDCGLKHSGRRLIGVKEVYPTSPAPTAGAAITCARTKYVPLPLPSIPRLPTPQIVLANGTITNITHITHPDLFFALRGGGSNFGIVTSFALETHPLIPHWWGGFDFFLLDAASHPPRPFPDPTSLSFYSIPTLSSLKDQAFHLLNRLGCLLGYCVDLDVFAEGLEKLVSHMADDELMTGYGTIAMLPGMGGTYGVGMNTMHYGGGEGLDAGKVGKEKEKEKAYLGVKKALGAKTIHSSLRRDSAMGFVRELDGWNPVGVRCVVCHVLIPQTPNTGKTTKATIHSSEEKGKEKKSADTRNRMTYHTATLRPNATLMAAIICIFFSEAETIRHLPDVQPAMSMQTISVDEIRHFGRNGGNTMGIKEEDGPLISTLPPSSHFYFHLYSSSLLAVKLMLMKTPI